ncbi:MAG: hypothetical protein AAGE52_37595 [Myxococcota bacterium]
MRVHFAMLAAFLAVISVPSAQSQTPRAVARALARLDASACAENPAWAARQVQVAAVVFPEGVVVNLSPGVRVADRAGLRTCLQSALNRALAQVDGRSPRRPRLVSRTITIPETRGLAAAIEAGLASNQASIERCLFESDRHRRRVGGRVRVQVAQGAIRDVEGDGSVRRCLQTAVRTRLPDGAAFVEVTATRTAVVRNLRRTDGTEGAVCQWGESELRGHDPSLRVPEPQPCQQGLTCCYSGGIAGLSSTCRSVAATGCPRFP